MAEINRKARIQSKGDTSSKWADAAAFIPLKNELILYTDLHKIKIGDGTTTVGNLPFLNDDNTTYTFAGGTNSFTVTPSGGSAQTVSVTPSISNNITGNGTRTNGYLAKFSGTNTVTNGPAIGTSTTTYLRNDGTWATPPNTNTTYTFTNGNNGSFTVKPSNGNAQTVTTTSLNGLGITASTTELNYVKGVTSAIQTQINETNNVVSNLSGQLSNLSTQVDNIDSRDYLIGGSQTSTSTADSGNNVFTFTKSDGTTATFTVKNGSRGSTGAAGTSVTVSSTATTYQASSSGTTIPTGTWNTTVPTVAKGQFLWTRTIVTFSDSKTATTYSVGYMGTNGTNGTNGAAAGFGTPTASVDANIGTPSVTVTATGSNTAKVFNFAFKNLKGAQGPAGITPTINAAAGTNIGAVGTPSVTASTNGTTTTFTFNNLKGEKGEAGTNATTTATGTATTPGLTKLYTSTGSATDGTMTQAAVTNAINNINSGATYSTSAPSSPKAGQLWFNPNAGYLQIYSGSAWVAIGAVWK